MHIKIVVAKPLLVLLFSAIAAADQLPRAFDFWLPSGGVLSHTGWLVGSLGDPATILLRKECSTELATLAANPSATTDDRITALAMLGLVAATRDDFDTAEVYVEKMAEFVGTKGARGAANSETIVAAFLLSASIKKELGKMEDAASYLRTGELILQGWESLEQPGDNLLRACIGYVGADVFMSSDSQRAFAASEIAYKFFRRIAVDRPTEYVYCASQYIVLCERLGRVELSDKAYATLNYFVETRSNKIGLARSHLDFANAIRFARQKNYARAIASAEEGRLRAESFVGLNSRSAKQFSQIIAETRALSDKNPDVNINQ